MARDFSTGKLLQINIHSSYIHDLHVEHHYNQIRFQGMPNCNGALGFHKVIRFTKNIGKKCVHNSIAAACEAISWLKVAFKKPKLKKDIAKDRVTLQLIREDIQEIKQIVKELQNHKCQQNSEEHVKKTQIFAPPPPPPPPPSMVDAFHSRNTPKSSPKSRTKEVSNVTPTRPTISLEELLKVKLRKPCERKFKVAGRKTVQTEEPRETLESIKSASSPRPELPSSPVSSLKRILSCNVDVNNRPKRRRMQFAQTEIP